MKDRRVKRGKYVKSGTVPPLEPLSEEAQQLLLSDNEKKRLRKEQSQVQEMEILDTEEVKPQDFKKKTGAIKGKKNRSTVVREILDTTTYGRNPLTGTDDLISQEYRITLAVLSKALKGDVNAYKALMDNAYKPHTQEVDTKIQTIDLSQFSFDELRGFLKDQDDYLPPNLLTDGIGTNEQPTYPSETSTGTTSEGDISER